VIRLVSESHLRNPEVELLILSCSVVACLILVRRVSGVGPVSQDPAELVLGGTWMPTLCITGVDGMPSIANAGNVLRSHTALRLSVRTPPSVEAKDVAAYFEKELTRDAPYGAKVTFVCDKAQKGWQAPKLAPWLATSLEKASQTFYGKSARSTGEGGSIPFMVSSDIAHMANDLVDVGATVRPIHAHLSFGVCSGVVDSSRACSARSVDTS
jgi:acetylornithine deacetylase/succinyl-diaminopimelate desuccinylase-like protein